MVTQADRLRSVRYDIRGPVLRHARALEAAGHRVVKLNIGNPAPWGLETPDIVVEGLVQNIQDAEGYSDARGIYPARLAVAQYYTAQFSRTWPRPQGVGGCPGPPFLVSRERGSFTWAAVVE